VAIEVPNSAVAVVEVDLTLLSGGFGSTADTVLALIGQELIQDGLTIAQKSVGFSGLTFPISGEFSATLQILNQSGQELDDTDLQAQFQDACDQVSVQVNSFGVQQVIGAPSGVNSGTGQQGNVITTGAGAAAATAAATHQCGDPTWTFFQDPAQWLQCLTQKGLSTVGLLAIGLLVGVVLIVGFQKRPTAI
jgi:hypothetical protein